MTRSHTFSRALRRLHVITSSFDWFNVLSVSSVIGSVIGSSEYFGFRFKTPIAKRTNDAITQTNSDKLNGMMENLTLFQAREQVFLKQFLNENLTFIFLLFLSEHANVVFSQGFNNLHSILRLRALLY